MVRQSKVIKEPAKRKALTPLSVNVIPTAKKQQQIGDFFSAVPDEKPSLIIADDDDDNCEHESDDYEDEDESSDEEEDDDDDTDHGEDNDDQDDDDDELTEDEEEDVVGDDVDDYDGDEFKPTLLEQIIVERVTLIEIYSNIKRLLLDDASTAAKFWRITHSMILQHQKKAETAEAYGTLCPDIIRALKGKGPVEIDRITGHVVAVFDVKKRGVLGKEMFDQDDIQTLDPFDPSLPERHRSYQMFAVYLHILSDVETDRVAALYAGQTCNMKGFRFRPSNMFVPRGPNAWSLRGDSRLPTKPKLPER